jgi:hypothetical protein
MTKPSTVNARPIWRIRFGRPLVFLPVAMTMLLQRPLRGSSIVLFRVGIPAKMKQGRRSHFSRWLVEGIDGQ